MKKFILGATLLLSFVFVSSAQAQEKEKKIQTAATSVTSRTPGIDGANNVKEFQEGENKLMVTRNSSKQKRKQAVKMSYELYKQGIITYEEHKSLAEDLAIKPGKK